MTTEVIDVESRELTVATQQQPLALIQGSPAEVVERATAMADQLRKVISQQHLFASIQGKQHVTVEGWTTLGAMVGVFPVVEWSRQVDDGWEARVEVRTVSGQTIGAAEAQCTRSESAWSRREDYALRSMAQTRATSKAMRLPLAWIMSLAGFEVTPAEEIPREPEARRPAAQAARPTPAAPTGAITDAQRRGIRAMLNDIFGSGDLSAVAQGEWCRMHAPLAATLRDGTDTYEVHLSGLTVGQASEMYDKLKAEKGV